VVLIEFFNGDGTFMREGSFSCRYIRNCVFDTSMSRHSDLIAILN